MGPLPAGLTQIEAIFSRVIGLSVGIAFIALLVMLIVSGFKYLTSGGEPKALQSAHQSLTWALLGVLFLASAWLILQLIAAFTGRQELTTLDIKVLCGPDSIWCTPRPGRVP